MCSLLLAVNFYCHPFLFVRAKLMWSCPPYHLISYRTHLYLHPHIHTHTLSLPLSCATAPTPACTHIHTLSCQACTEPIPPSLIFPLCTSRISFTIVLIF